MKLFKDSLLFITSLLLLPCMSSAADLPAHDTLQNTLREVVAEKNGGFGFNMWASIVDRDGVVKNVAFSGKERGDQWPGSRVIAAQKAHTANAFALPGFSLSTANLFSAVQPGGSLFGLQESNPVDTKAAYGGDAEDVGTDDDPMVDKRVGGVNVFGGGLPLYNSKSELIGALGVSGDSSCADHNIAWKLRHKLGLDYVPKGVSKTQDDNIVNDVTSNKSKGGWGHPSCSPEATKIAAGLPKDFPISKIETTEKAS